MTQPDHRLLPCESIADTMGATIGLLLEQQQEQLTVALVVAQVGALDALDVHHLVQVVLRDAVLQKRYASVSTSEMENTCGEDIPPLTRCHQRSSAPVLDFDVPPFQFACSAILQGGSRDQHPSGRLNTTAHGRSSFAWHRQETHRHVTRCVMMRLTGPSGS